MEIFAIDKLGNKFKKIVILGEYNGQPTVGFGGPIIYYVNDLLKHYPFTIDFDIDMMGKNHGGFGTGPVCIKKDDMNRIIEELLMN